MKENKIIPKLIKWHFYLLGFILINYIIELTTGYRLNQNLIFFLKIFLYLTGVILFFNKLKPFKLLLIYFSFYTLSGLFIGIFFLFGGIFLAISSSIFLYPIYPKQTHYKTEEIKIYGRFRGFLSPCCSYEIAENKLSIFEKHLGYINIERPINTFKDEFSLVNNKIIYKYELEKYEYNNLTGKMRDTTELLPIK